MLIDSLTARGETTQDLRTNLFKAYASCSDSTFVRYISDIQTKWEEGEDITAERLMERAANKYKIMKTKEIWNAPSAEQEKLVALEAKITSLKQKYDAKKNKLNKKKGKKKGMKRDGWMHGWMAASEAIRRARAGVHVRGIAMGIVRQHGPVSRCCADVNSEAEEKLPYKKLRGL